ncbi:MAG: SAP domain-containing protein [Spirochaetaceae bacterium]
MRPLLDTKIDPEEFLSFYWLKEELFTFCKMNSLPGSGSKDDITSRIYKYLKTGEVIKPVNHSKKISINNSPLNLDAIIPEGYKNDERHREFFKSEIGEHFKFNVTFMNWMKVNNGKTYKDAITEWNRIIADKKKGKKTEISSQFQYNQYTRDFFKNNANGKREDAIKCWKYKKALPGHNRYEECDMVALQESHIGN